MSPEEPIKLPDANTQSISDIDTIPLSSIERFGAQWRVWYANKRKLHETDTRQIILGQIFTLTIIGAGSVLLEDNKDALLIIGTALLVYPVLTALMASSAASLSTAIHHELDFLRGRKKQIRTFLRGWLNALVVSVSSSLLIGAAAGLIGVLLLDTAFIMTFQLAVFVTILTSLIGFPIIIGATILVRTLKSNPDDVSAPLESTVFSILTLLAIIYVSRFLQ